METTNKSPSETILEDCDPWSLLESIEDDDRPSSFLDCLDDDGQVIEEQYKLFKEKEDELEEAEERIQAYLLTMGEEGRKKKTTRKKRKFKSIKPFYIDDNGAPRYLVPRQTYWYLMYVRTSPENLECAKFKKKFRRRFRMPYKQYLELLSKLQGDSMFSRWKPNKKDATGKLASPLELLLLGALRYLGRGLTFDDLEEFTAIGEETHRQFFHIFIEWGATKLYPVYVRMPTTAAEYDGSEYNTGGLTGAGFSTDATNVVMWRCPQNQKQANMGFKQSHPARTYNLTCNHRRRILYTTPGHPSRWNDKSLAHVDDFLSGIHEGKILQDVEFSLFAWSGAVGSSSIVETKYRGAWGLVDNGYHRWACTQAPDKVSLLRANERLSEWIESFRKDAECTFGILKGRWRILQTGIRLEGPQAADNVWLTCCALHNLLLEADGLSEPWDESIGRNDVGECRQYAPFAIQRLADKDIARFGTRAHEREAAAAAIRDRMINQQRDDGDDIPEDPGDNVEDDDYLEEQQPAVSEDGAIYVNSLSYGDFRSRLVIQFDILFRQHKIKWPTRK